MSEHHKDEAFPGDRNKLVRCIEAVLELHQHGLVKEGIPKMLRQLLRASVLHLNAPAPIKRENLSTHELLNRAMARLRGTTAAPQEAALIVALGSCVPVSKVLAEAGTPATAFEQRYGTINQGKPVQGPWGEGYLFGYNQGFAAAAGKVNEEAVRQRDSVIGSYLAGMAKILRDDLEREQRNQKAAGCTPTKLAELMAENSDLRAKYEEISRQLANASDANDTLRRELNAAHKELAELQERNDNQRASIEALHKAIPKPVNAEIRITRAAMTTEDSGAQYQAYDVEYPRPRDDLLGNVGKHFHALRVVKRIAGKGEDTVAFAEIDRRLTQA